MAESHPQRIGSYEILALLGDGGSGPVYHGLHLQLARPAAIKVLRDDLAQDPNVVRRFQREARIAAQLHHPNIVEIYDTGERDGFFYIARGLVDGQTLRQLLAERRPALGETVRLTRQIADALDHAHERGVIHRSLNPGGIVIDRRGQVTVVDFGIAGAIEDLIPVTGDPTTMSTWFETPAYIAPEQATGQPAVPASDIYALGAIVYEMLTGEPPFSRIGPQELLASLLRETPPLPTERNPSLPQAVDDVVMRALEKNPSDRYTTGGEFVSAIVGVLGTGELQRSRLGIPPIVLAPTSSPAAPTASPPPATPPPPAAAPAVAPGPAPEPIVIERIVYRSRRHEPAVWYGVGTTLLAIALLLNLFWDDDGDSASADAGLPAAVTATSQVGIVDPTATATEEPPATATPVEPTATDIIEPTPTATALPSPIPTEAATATPSPTETPAPPPPGLAAGGELILFSTTRDDVPAGLLITSPEGDEQVSVFDEDVPFTDASQYTVSPDGSALAFAATPDDGDDREIYVLSIAGRELSQLTDAPGDDTMPLWSADGSLIAFISNRDGNSEIYVMNADGTDPENVTNDPAADYSPVWAPDDAEIAFVSNRTGNNEIWVVDGDGSNPQNLTNNPAADWGPDWSPDGNQIAFGSNRDGNDDIFVMDVNGSNPQNLTNDPAADNYPIWSPNGEWIAFVSDRDDSPDVFVMTPDGDDIRPVGATIYEEGEPTWSPDSTALALTITIEGDSDVVIAPIDDTTLRRLTDDPAADTGPRWVEIPESGA